MIASFEKKPAKSGMPTSASEPISDVIQVIGMYLRRPPMLRMSCSWCMRDDHRAGAEEQQRLEERVRHQVEDRRRVGRRAERHGHVAELRQRRIGDHALDVVLHDAEEAP